MQRSPRSISSSQSPIDPHDRGREPERVEYRRARQDTSRSPPAPSARVPQGPPTALPSIHNLHLPPPHAPRHAAPAQQYSPSEFLPSASYGSSTFFAGSQRSPALSSSIQPPAYRERRMSFDQPSTGTRVQSSSSAYPEQHISPPEADSDQEQNDSERGPPKKKRRRQALSCTECKRRKIKCDRTHPCGPCARRSEPEKCQWHVIEPVAHGAFRPAGVSYSDKYVTRSEWDELYARYRVLEDRCIRLEKLVVQLHPEITENPSYEVAARHPAAMSSPRTPHVITTRSYPLAGPGISSTGASSGAPNQRVTPHTPVSALPGPGPSPHHGPGSAAPALPVSSSTGAEGSASTRSGSAPPPMFATAVPHPPGHSDRRTSASGSHASFATPSERSSVPHQVPETVRGRPFTTPTAHSYTLPPPPPRPDNPPGYSPSRSHRNYLQGFSAAAAETSSMPSPMPYPTRVYGRSYPSPLSAVSTGRHMHPDNAVPEEVDGEYGRRYDRDTRHDRRGSFERPDPPRTRDTESKNGEAQASEAGDALRHRGSASDSCNMRYSSSPLQWRPERRSVSAISPMTHSKFEDARSEDSVPSSPRCDSPEPSTSSRKRVHSGGRYLSLPSCGSAADTPQPAVVVH